MVTNLGWPRGQRFVWAKDKTLDFQVLNKLSKQWSYDDPVCIQAYKMFNIVVHFEDVCRKVWFHNKRRSTTKYQSSWIVCIGVNCQFLAMCILSQDALPFHAHLHLHKTFWQCLSSDDPLDQHIFQQ